MLRFTTCFVFLILNATPSLADQSENWKNLTKESTALFGQKKYQEAVNLSKAAAEISKDENQDWLSRKVVTLIQLGAAYQALDLNREAEASFFKAFQLQTKADPHDYAGQAQTLMYLAELKLKQNEFDSSRSILLSVVDRLERLLNGKSGLSLVEPLRQLGLIEMRKRNFEQASKILQRALEINENSGVKLDLQLGEAIRELVGIVKVNGDTSIDSDLEKRLASFSPQRLENKSQTPRPLLNFILCTPSYPTQALPYGLQGETLFKALVDVDGKPIELQLLKSSGWKMLDDAVMNKVAGCHHLPAIQQGNPALEWATVEYRWRLAENGQPITSSFSLKKDSCAASSKFIVAKDNETQSTIRLGFSVDRDGRAQNIEVIDESNSKQPGADQLAIDFLKTCTFKMVNTDFKRGFLRLKHASEATM